MDKYQQKAVMNIIDEEGFEYAFVHYSDFNDIECKAFHQLRKEYLRAREELAKLIGYADE